jgi:hypothetical protein
MKTKRTYKDLTVTIDINDQCPVSVAFPWTGALHMTKEEANWLRTTLDELLSVVVLTQETESSNPPPDQL